MFSPLLTPLVHQTVLQKPCNCPLLPWVTLGACRVMPSAWSGLRAADGSCIQRTASAGLIRTHAWSHAAIGQREKRG